MACGATKVNEWSISFLWVFSILNVWTFEKILDNHNSLEKYPLNQVVAARTLMRQLLRKTFQMYAHLNATSCTYTELSVGGQNGKFEGKYKSQELKKKKKKRGLHIISQELKKKGLYIISKLTAVCVYD